MTIQTRTDLKAFFETGDRPTQTQFGDLIDSLVSMGTGDTNTGSVAFSSSILVSGSLITGGAASFAGSIVVVGTASLSGSATIGGTACVSGSIIVDNVLILSGSGTGTNGSRIVFYDSNVAHGMTALLPTNAFGEINRFATCGGVQIRGFSGSTVGFLFTGVAACPDTGKSTGAHAYFHLRGACKNGTGQRAAGVDENLVVIQSFTTTRHIFDSEGDYSADAAVGASAFDDHDDIGLVRSLEVERIKQVAPSVGLREEFGKWARYNKRELQRLKIATFNDGPGEDGSVFINYTALARLHSGAIWQLAQKIDRIERQLLPSSGCNYIDLIDSG